MLIVIILFAIFIISTTISNLKKSGIASGFDFLDTEAGFGVLMSLIEYNESSTYGRAFWVGLFNTLLVSALGIFLSTILGFIIGIARLSINWLVSTLAGFYVELVRNIPLLLQLFFWYFAVLRSLPLPKESIIIFNLFLLNN